MSSRFDDFVSEKGCAEIGCLFSIFKVCGYGFESREKCRETHRRFLEIAKQEQQKTSDVRVFCPICKGGDNVIWQGSLIDWGVELSKAKPPAWFLYARNHEKAHGHKVMVKYPDRIVPLGRGELGK